MSSLDTQLGEQCLREGFWVFNNRIVYLSLEWNYLKASYIELLEGRYLTKGLFG